MSNLGLYQKITTFMKKVGGPKKGIAIIAVGGYAFIRTLEAGGKYVYKKIAKINSDDVTTLGTFVVKKEAKDDQGLSFVKGDRFNVLEIDDDSVLIEKIGDSENPYFVSGEFLESISDFRKK